MEIPKSLQDEIQSLQNKLKNAIQNHQVSAKPSSSDYSLIFILFFFSHHRRSHLAVISTLGIKYYAVTFATV